MPEAGCALATLGPEMSRPEPDDAEPPGPPGPPKPPGLAETPMAQALRTGSVALVAALADEIGVLHPALPAAERRARALAVLSTLIGGIVLARALAADADASLAALATAARLARAAADIPQNPG
jgi:hypothetical protein